MTTMKNLLLVLFSACSLALAGCGGDGGTSTTPAPAPAPAPAPVPTPPPQTDDHGGTEQTATEISVPSATQGEPTSTQGEIQSGEDVDYFRLQIRSPGALTVYTTGSTDTLGVLTGPDGFTELSDDNSGAESNFNIEAPVSEGVYFLQVRPGSSLVTGGYILHVAFSEGTEDDHGGTEQTATEIEVPSATQGEPTDTQGEIQSGDDVDYFRLDIRSRGVLTVYTTGSTDTLGVLTGPDGFTELSDDNSGAESNFSIEAPVSEGVYFLQVSLGSSLVTGEYTLHVQFLEGAEMATEVDVPLNDGEVWLSGFLIEDDVHYYRLQIRHRDRQMSIYNSHAAADVVDLLLIGPSGFREDVFTRNLAQDFRLFNVSPGVYYFRISLRRIQQTNYNIRVGFATPP